MTITVKKTHENNIELTPPLFWKQEGHEDYIGFLDEKTVVRMWTFLDGSRINIVNGTAENMKERLIEAYTDFLPIDESQFMRAFDEAYEAIRLEPMEIETGRQEALRDYAKDNAL